MVTEKPCIPCGGNGFTTETPSGAFAMFQTRVMCQPCESTGKVKTIHSPCGNCKSTGRVSEKNIIEPFIKPGDSPGTRYSFPGMGNYTGDSPTGDVVIIVNQEPNSTFKRRGNDIHVNQELTLTQSLTGFKIDIEHIDGRMVQISSEEGRVTPPGTQVKILGEGIPRGKGNLIVSISVKFPKTLSGGTVQELKKLSDL